MERIFNGKKVLLPFFLMITSCGAMSSALAKEPNYYINLLKEMFEKVTIEKNEKAIPTYYDSEFELSSNGKTMNYKQFLQVHKDVYKTSIQYSIRSLPSRA
ncbi:hypothetical protein [Legionella waltersii]|uniref:Uncharacterized protein n=1 Tax=Legionella waltersii TaxID=66969 RepID=A0A0W1AJS6_9GAMM|nr:hypothetical protein [Legionella waltersii]KTD81589.1 hypothetical protein Lwal_1026 [Legionella waltersii]SNV13152.1 Uncharacterised protein [Legionella waltersii]